VTLAYYNEIDPYCAQWLRNLISKNLIAPGHVDERSILDVKPYELEPYTQCHFFAGIGGWSYALRLAGVSDHRKVWTGSCPCQPFSLAGSRRGFADDRDLWPFWNYLIAQRRPATIFGEQVASAVEWLARTRSDLEEMDYAVGCMPIEAASNGAPQLRDRYWFVADDDSQREANGYVQRSGQLGGPSRVAQDHRNIMAGGFSKQLRTEGFGGTKNTSRGMQSANKQWERFWNDAGQPGTGGSAGVLASERSERSERLEGSEGFAANNGTQQSAAERSDSILLEQAASNGWGEGWTESEFRSRGFTASVASIGGFQFVECPDGKWRRLPPPGVRWLGNAIPSRVAKLRAFGNAIVPQVAAQFIKAALDL
jgi:DNA (cytosine-5)-methyltransferase 1